MPPSWKSVFGSFFSLPAPASPSGRIVGRVETAGADGAMFLVEKKDVLYKQ